MFGISLAESLIVILVGMAVLGPQKLIRVLKKLREMWGAVRKEYQATIKSFDIIENLPAEMEVTHILDVEGKLQRTYNLSQIMPDLKRNAND